MPRSGSCDHRDCPPGDCQQLTSEELMPTPEDIEFGRKLVREGWCSVSTKYRHVRRWKTPPPPVEALMTIKALESYHGQRLAALWRRHGMSTADLRGPSTSDEGIEELTLTVRQWKAFRTAGGHSA